RGAAERSVETLLRLRRTCPRLPGPGVEVFARTQAFIDILLRHPGIGWSTNAPAAGEAPLLSGSL
ncbi:MAG: hypothetical protein J2P48_18520, partial [Alphaproteobacteria bacterium]|nr:hypothetical protein [Alphaproteobacteria bacterium]